MAIEVSMEGRFIKVTMETTEAVELCAVIEDKYAWIAECEEGLRARLKGVLTAVASDYPGVKRAQDAREKAWEQRKGKRRRA